MIDAQTRDRFRFFLENAGYATPPGRAACALSLARVERRAECAGVSHEWVDDDDAPSFYGDDEPGPWFGCIVRLGELTESLWGIGLAGPNDPYMRVIEAELADELFYRRDALAAEANRIAWSR